MLNTRGKTSDLHLLIDHRWLCDTEVKVLIPYRKGRWIVYLIFVSLETPLKFITKRINDYNSLAKANFCAQMYRRNASKDTRGNLKSNLDDLNLSRN
jgi:hypothetical protein